MAEPHEAAKWRVDDRDEAPVREPMTGKGTKPAQKRKPDTDQKKVRREMARSATDDRGRTHDICANCGEAIHDGAGIDPNVPWVHEHSGNAKCDVGQPADAVMLQGVETDLAHPMYRSSVYTAQDFRDTVIRDFEERQAMRKGAPFAGYKDFEACVAANKDKRDPEAYCGKIKHQVEDSPKHSTLTRDPSWMGREADIDRAGDRECEACGQVASPVLGDTGPVCSRCGSYSLKQAPHKQPARAAYALKQATRMDTNVATSDGRILINPGDQIKTPTGQALTVKNIRRHETSRDHYYIDTDAGTTLVPWTTNFTLVPNNQSQQFLPGTGTPGGNSSGLPGLEQGVSNEPPNVCPACGSKGSLTRQGQAYKCSRCGYSEKNVGMEQNFSDVSQMPRAQQRTTSRTSSLIAQRARQVLDQEEENPS